MLSKLIFSAIAAVTLAAPAIADERGRDRRAHFAEQRHHGGGYTDRHASHGRRIDMPSCSSPAA